MFNCLVVDDEPIARDIILNYCSHLPQLRVLGSCGNVFEAKEILLQHPIDILFLDVHMPVLDGIAFLRTLKNKPQVIFTTAYKEYAVDAFELSACDYLVKPYSLERFIMAVDKATENRKAAGNEVNENRNTTPTDYFFIKADGKIYKLLYNQILLAEAKGNYTRIVCADQTLLPNMSFSSFESLLPPDLFIRVHRSFIINKSKIDHIEGNMVEIQQTQIPIGMNYKEPFLKALGI
ncbi:DNA-binding response regulator [Niastella yeongjuensis]|uniref:DNA-binding response regulator n=1 Tax=Niastella yeongjuensis TaxID=354355 RepID=A0A1V9E9Z8_9BACT|nr:LytTR family DNA-binding domain-containing protein [Niastella yeongjuensis]OQP42957.1 DNA-binding response regulator [Niastella yeongjuensis]SEO60891.1 two component transcriptional regulator, LytTR family [Niastella yeongjuensis]